MKEITPPDHNSEIVTNTREESLFNTVCSIIIAARKNTIHAINQEMVLAYWNIGRAIILEEQNGKNRAEYGESLIRNLAKKLTHEHGRGFSEVNLKNFRKFYLTFPNVHTSGTLSDQEIGYTVCTLLSWSHYRLLMRVENPSARAYYMKEAISDSWSVRALERQINSLYYERLLASRDKEPVIEEAQVRTTALALSPEAHIRDPYILEFLNLDNLHPALLEQDLEQALLKKLQHFLLELGRGFSFVARQYRIITETSDFYIDLVFYHYILKCFILIDLKTGKLSHQDIGQMDMYVRMFEDRIKQKEDNPTIGLILCTEKDETVVRYSVLHESRHLFASRYHLFLPTEQELIQEIEREKVLISLKKGETKD
jgi:predicted nuclease of restriction endonuclease-like (RecB) superfamily